MLLSVTLLQIMVDFELDSPKPIDFHAVKNLLSGLMGRGQNAALSGIADAVLEQDELTTVVRVSGDDEIFGFISVLNYHKYSNLEGVKQLKDFILQKAGEHKATLSTIFEDGNQSLGIILNERMFNVPPQLAFPLHNVLFGNINSQVSIHPPIVLLEWSKENGRFKCLLICLKRSMHANNQSDLLYHKIL